jgi:hypothetical protein
MNLGWIRHLFTLSDLEKGRIAEAQPDPRRIEGFADLETAIAQSLTPVPTVTVQTTTHPILNDQAQPKTGSRTLERPLADQDLLQKLLKHRPNYSSNRILRAETAASLGARTNEINDQEGNP